VTCNNRAKRIPAWLAGIQVEGLEGDLLGRCAKKVTKRMDAGKLHVTLVTTEGDAEVVGFDPEKRVKVVGEVVPDSRGRAPDVRPFSGTGGAGPSAGGHE
jgi:hypothetical protein